MINTKSKRICDVNTHDEKFAETFLHQVNSLSEMVIEMMEDNKGLVLSPVFRRMLADKAREVENMRAKLTYRLVIDNPGDPL